MQQRRDESQTFLPCFGLVIEPHGVIRSTKENLALVLQICEWPYVIIRLLVSSHCRYSVVQMLLDDNSLHPQCLKNRIARIRLKARLKLRKKLPRNRGNITDTGHRQK